MKNIVKLPTKFKEIKIDSLFIDYIVKNKTFDIWFLRDFRTIDNCIYWSVKFDAITSENYTNLKKSLNLKKIEI